MVWYSHPTRGDAEAKKLSHVDRKLREGLEHSLNLVIAKSVIQEFALALTPEQAVKRILKIASEFGTTNRNAHMRFMFILRTPALGVVAEAFSSILIYRYTEFCRMESTTVKVSRQTAKKLSALQRSINAKSLDETIDLLVRKHRKELIDQIFGVDRERISPFSEEDRGEDRS